MKGSWILSGVVILSLSACGGGDYNHESPHYVEQISVPGVGAGSNFGFDISVVSGSSYSFTDRNNSAVDIVDIPSLTVTAQISGTGANSFAGLKPSNANSGPDGLAPVGSLLYVGDVNSVKIVDPTTKQVIKTIVVGNEGVRADEGCLDPVHKVFMVSTPEAAVPFATFIDTVSQSIIATVTFTDASNALSAGLEACRYDVGTDTFYVNNDGTTANPHGELDALPGAAIRGIPAGGSVNYTALVGVRTSGEGDCDPTGLALGAGTDIAVGCREGTTGSPLLVLVFNRSTGALVASINAGGGDQLEYDAGSNRYYNAASRWSATGTATVNGACSAASPCTPVLFIIDAASHEVVSTLPSGNNAHSVAVDPVSGLAFMPFSSATAPAGCATCANGFVNPGIAVFSIRD